jgi:hypothetical protein
MVSSPLDFSEAALRPTKDAGTDLQHADRDRSQFPSRLATGSNRAGWSLVDDACETVRPPQSEKEICDLIECALALSARGTRAPLRGGGE